MAQPVTLRFAARPRQRWQASDPFQVGPEALNLAGGVEHEDVFILVAAEPARALKVEGLHG